MGGETPTISYWNMRSVQPFCSKWLEGTFCVVRREATIGYFSIPEEYVSCICLHLPQTSTKCRYLVIQSDLFEMVKWPFQGVKWPPTRGWKGQFESPGKYLWDTMQRFFVYTWILENPAGLETAPTPSAIFKKWYLKWWFGTGTPGTPPYK